MVYYTEETPGVNKRMVTGYYLFLCLIGFAILLGPTGSGIPITLIGNEARDEHSIATPDWGDDPADCSVCHSNEYGNWSDTNHATHMDEYNSTHIRIGAYAWVSWGLFNSTCAECHTSGWDNSTGTPTYDFLGVNCFACHNGTPTVDYSGEACSDCHKPSGEEHPHQYVPWQNSAHANSLTDLRSSDHAASYCMHCMSTEAFVDTMTDGSDTFEPTGDYNSIGCPACHAVHANWSVTTSMIRANTTNDLCGLCHVGSNHDSYNVWIGGPHSLAGVDCIDCHGYDVALGDNVFLNHTFEVNPDLACGQSEECHEGLEDWANAQLEEIQGTFETLVEEFWEEANAIHTVVSAYNETAGANYTLANYVLGVIEDAESTVKYYENDRSEGFHYPTMILDEVNAAFRDVLEAKAYFHQYVPSPATSDGGGIIPDTLVIVGVAAGGILIGLLLGVLVGRRR